MTTPRQRRREENLLRSESRWLQKGLFNLTKVRQAREKLADARGEKHHVLEVDVDGRTISIDDVEAFFRARAEAVNEELGISTIPVG